MYFTRDLRGIPNLHSSTEIPDVLVLTHFYRKVEIRD